MRTSHRRVPAADTVVLLGPQRLRPTVARTLNALGARGTVATVTAGWQEREADDAELEEHLGGRAVNLEPYARYLDIRESDHWCAVADARRREILLEMRELYEVRLDAAQRGLRPASAPRNRSRPRRRGRGRDRVGQGARRAGHRRRTRRRPHRLPAPLQRIPLDDGDRIDCGAVSDKQRVIRPDGQVKAREAA